MCPWFGQMVTEGNADSLSLPPAESKEVRSGSEEMLRKLKKITVPGKGEGGELGIVTDLQVGECMYQV